MASDFDRIDRSGGFFEDLPMSSFSRIATARSATVMPPAIANSAVSYPSQASSAAPRKKPTPFSAFFDPVSTATSRNRALSPSPATYFTALFELILVRSLATPDSAWAPMTYATDTHSTQAGECRARITSATI